jgi:hypothetical protein
MTVAIGWQNRVIPGVPLAMQVGAAAAGLPLDFLLDEQPRVRARLVGATVAFVADFGAPTALDWVALIDTTIPAGATVLVEASNTDPTGAAAEEGSASVTAAGTVATRGNVHVSTAGWSARYLRVTVSGLADGCDIGLLYAGPLFSLTYGIQSMEEGRHIQDGRDRNPITGAEFVLRALDNPRYIAGALRFTRAEIDGAHRDLLAAAAGHGDVLLIPNDADTQANLSARALWGAINEPGARVGVRRVALHGLRAFIVTDRL